MRLTQLQYLLEIKKHGSISKAAQHLYIAQPSMSAAIRELETELGYELMKRSKKGTVLTKLGEEVAEKAVIIVQTMESIRCLGKEQTGRMRGRIFLSAVPFVCEYVLLDLIVQLKEQHPDLLLLLDENNAYTILQQVNRREMDLGIIMMCSNEESKYQKEFEKNNLAFVELYQDEMYFWVGRRNPYYSQQRALLSELLQYPYVYYKDSFTDEDRELFRPYCNLEELETVRMKDRESIKKYVIYSQAVTAMPFSAGKNNVYLEAGLLKPIQISDIGWSCRIGIVHRKDMPLTREEQFVIERLQKMVQEKNYVTQIL